MVRSLGRMAKPDTAAALAMALALGCTAPSSAMADEVGTGTGTMTINKTDNKDGMSHNAYQILTCDVDSDGKNVTNIGWPDDSMATVVRETPSFYMIVSNPTSIRGLRATSDDSTSVHCVGKEEASLGTRSEVMSR